MLLGCIPWRQNRGWKQARADERHAQGKEESGTIEEDCTRRGAKATADRRSPETTVSRTGQANATHLTPHLCVLLLFVPSPRCWHGSRAVKPDERRKKSHTRGRREGKPEDDRMCAMGSNDYFRPRTTSLSPHQSRTSRGRGLKAKREGSRTAGATVTGGGET